MLRSSAVTTADAERLWEVVSDVEAWSRHLSTFTSVTHSGGLAVGDVGSRYDVRQPGLPSATYEVTQWSPGAFTWQARSSGITTTATHVVTDVEAGARLELTVAWSGPLALPVRLLMGRRTRRMIELEASTLAAVAESRG